MMPFEVRPVIFWVSIFFMEDAYNFFLECSANLRRMLAQYATHSQPSVVRKIGSYLTWIHAKRLHIVWREDVNSTSSSSNNAELQLLNKLGENSTYSMELEAKVEEMQKELLSIQSQVTKLLLAQEQRLLCIDDENTENTVTSTTSVIPPPPPPMPPIPLVNSNQVVVKIKPKSTTPLIENQTANSIIEELSKKRPKLRHVELTPGGRPLRHREPVHPSDILIHVLKKRFDAMHSPS